MNQWYPLPRFFRFFKNWAWNKSIWGICRRLRRLPCPSVVFSKAIMAGNFYHTSICSRSDIGRSESRQKIEVWQKMPAMAAFEKTTYENTCTYFSIYTYIYYKFMYLMQVYVCYQGVLFMYGTYIYIYIYYDYCLYNVRYC